MMKFVWNTHVLSLVLLLSQYSSGQSLTANNHALIFDPANLNVAVGHNTTTTIQLVSEHDEPIHVTFVYGEDRSATTDYITPLEPVDFHRYPSRVQIVLSITGLRPGHLIIGCNASPAIDGNLTEHDFLRINIARSTKLDRVISIVGWLYFAAWSCSFYPQIVLNLQRQSVVGLNFDFLALNLVGFFCYSVYNIALYSWGNVQNGYRKLHPHGVIPVLSNDVVFGLHGFIATLITIIQCLLFERGRQRVSFVTCLLILVLVVFLSITSAITAVGKIDLLLLIYFYSYVKLLVSCIKYLPQALMNYRRKSTEGWSIGNIFLDLTGGILSLVQMILFAINYDDWSSLFGSLTKLGLGLLSIGFDLIFIIQHYKFYRTNKPPALGDYRVLDDNDDTAPAHT